MSKKITRHGMLPKKRVGAKVVFFPKKQIFFSIFFVVTSRPMLVGNVILGLERTVKRHWLGIVVFVFLLSEVARLLDANHIDKMAYNCDILRLLIGYSHGFGGRRLVGTIFEWLLPNCNLSIYNFITPFFVVGLIALLLFCLVLEETTGKHKNKDLLALLCVYLLGQYSFRFFFCTSVNDIFLVIGTLLFVTLYINSRKGLAYYLGTGLLLVANLLTHHIFIFTFFPCFVGLFAYDTLKERWNVPKMVAYTTIIALLAATCLATFLLSKPLDLGLFIRDVQAKNPLMTVVSEVKVLWDFQFNRSLKENWTFFMLRPWRVRVTTFLYVLLSFLPFSAMLSLPFRAQWKRATCVRERWMWGILWALPLTVLPAYVVAYDFGRWTAALLFSQLMVLLVIATDKPEILAPAKEDLLHFAKTRPVLASLAVALTLFLMMEPKTSFYDMTYLMRLLLHKVA